MSRTIRFLIRWSWCLSKSSSRNSRIERATSVSVTLLAGTHWLVLKFPTEFRKHQLESASTETGHKARPFTFFKMCRGGMLAQCDYSSWVFLRRCWM